MCGFRGMNINTNKTKRNSGDGQNVIMESLEYYESFPYGNMLQVFVDRGVCSPPCGVYYTLHRADESFDYDAHC